MNFRALSLSLVLAALLSGCGHPVTESPSANRPSGDKPYRIVTTVAMVADIVREVAGDKAEVVGLLKGDADPHLYQPTRDDIQQILDADVVFYSGLLLEGHMQTTFERAARAGKPVFAVTDVLDKQQLRTPPEFEGHHDPHVWMDVAAWSRCVGAVADRLAEFDPDNADYYQANRRRYCDRLAALHEYVQTTVASIPEDQRVLITAHDAFGYFSETYGIEVRSVQGITTESEAGVNDINRLIDFIVERRIPALFVEASVNPAAMGAVVAGARRKGWEVEIGGELYSDSMGSPGSYEGTYIGMIDHNATTIARALGGRPREGGFAGRLAAAGSGG